MKHVVKDSPQIIAQLMAATCIVGDGFSNIGAHLSICGIFKEKEPETKKCSTVSMAIKTCTWNVITVSVRRPAEGFLVVKSGR